MIEGAGPMDDSSNQERGEPILASATSHSVIDDQSLNLVRQLQQTAQHAEVQETVGSLRRSRIIEFGLFILVALMLAGLVWGQYRSNSELRRKLYNNCVAANEDSRQRNNVYLSIAEQLPKDSTERATLLKAVQVIKPRYCTIYLADGS